MHVLILGGGGFIGHQLAKYLLKVRVMAIDGNPPVEISKLVLFDRLFPNQLPMDPLLEKKQGNLATPDTIRQLLSAGPDIIFHLAAIVSGEAEKNFDLGMEINLHATLRLLEESRKLSSPPVLIFASSCAVFGGNPEDLISDDTATLPRSSYGTQKAVVELLINDYSRRKFINGRALRLPTIVVRPGAANAATSSFASSIIREPLNGEKAACPVAVETRIYIHSPGKVITNLVHAAAIRGTDLGLNRIITLPGITVSVAEMIAALEKIAGKETSGLIEFQPDPFIQSIVLTWPTLFNTKRALSLGFHPDHSIEDMILDYQREELSPNVDHESRK